MRDLGQLSFSSGGNLRKKALLRLAVLVLVLLGAFVLWGRFAGGVGGGGDITLQNASSGLKAVAVEDIASADGVNLVVESAAMRDTKYGGSAQATVTRSFGGGVYVLNIDATLPDPVNTNYQVWLVGGGEVIPIDYMRGSKTSWSLSLRSQDKYSGYSGIWITLERSKDEFPEEHVMEGSF